MCVYNNIYIEIDRSIFIYIYIIYYETQKIYKIQQYDLNSVNKQVSNRAIFKDIKKIVQNV